MESLAVTSGKFSVGMEFESRKIVVCLCLGPVSKQNLQLLIWVVFNYWLSFLPADSGATVGGLPR